MTDITELALRLKLEAHRAVSNFNPQMNIKTRDLMELVEALEKAQGMEAYWKTQCRGITDHCEELQARIAELESRTVTVENLQESAYRAGLTAGWNLGLANNNEGFNKCLAAHTAGIKGRLSDGYH
ncbi:TPA: hypothetical protein MBF03_002172 [Klebsiella pneumoniae]|uniref:hypothetical protein n=1 Tax=Klebsiella pneumoniae TaxID=573 RepID=UPI000E2C419A|nr:hypothetical protein [Klebsiella pneumoniae]EIX9704085.1 hypothetical protein [Klebsiella pneumoniae]EKZ9845807.1 hypothetical protein [Klebsiella pneumoniae]SYI39640.1 Uncharacterised protein [Klebsiella pneumoniae]HBT3020836.1 hypothetical protein [Klebsiella pneumoniae]HCF7966064.1 hypothetical protein [Klebsiella pneumoniae]